MIKARFLALSLMAAVCTTSMVSAQADDTTRNAVLGAVAGGVIGNVASNGDAATTLLSAAAGGLLGVILSDNDDNFYREGYYRNHYYYGGRRFSNINDYHAYREAERRHMFRLHEQERYSHFLHKRQQWQAAQTQHLQLKHQRKMQQLNVKHQRQLQKQQRLARKRDLQQNRSVRYLGANKHPHGRYRN